MSDTSAQLELVKKNIKCYPDFPKPGVMFRDVFSVMSNPEAAEALKELLFAQCTEFSSTIQAVCALETRGFLFGPLISLYLQVPFVPIRKKGKLPGEVKNISYDLEYGTDIFEIQSNALAHGLNVLLVDDLLASGGSLAAGCKLVNSIGCEVKACLVVIELKDLMGRNKVPSPVLSLIKL